MDEAEIEFLRARLDETGKLARAYLDHAIARKRPGPERWGYAQVLREVQAQQLILERYERARTIPESAVSFTAGQDDGYRQACEDALRDFNAIYSDHPDYRPEWKAAA